MGTGNRNGENGGRGTYPVTVTNHGEEGAKDGGRDVGDTGGGGSLGSGRDTFGGYLHWPYQGTMAQLVALRPIFEIYAREKGCNGDQLVAIWKHCGMRRRQRLSSR